MREKEGGNWLCYIRPLDVENGLATHQQKRIYFSFMRDGMKYQIKIAQTSTRKF